VLPPRDELLRRLTNAASIEPHQVVLRFFDTFADMLSAASEPLTAVAVAEAFKRSLIWLHLEGAGKAKGASMAAKLIAADHPAVLGAVITDREALGVAIRHYRAIAP
jgi:hypothetical protein